MPMVMQHSSCFLGLRLLSLVFGWLGGACIAGEPDSVPPALPPKLRWETSSGEQPWVLVGPDARRQALVTFTTDEGSAIDVTRQVRYRSEPAGIVEVDPTGLIRPLSGGSARLIAEEESGLSASIEVSVVQWAEDPTVHFQNQIVPIFTKLGCNGGGCHGKAAGQNGFKLSLLGFEPREDFEHLVKESRGRRLTPARADDSLLLTKATNRVPHGGGARLKDDSHEYRLLRRWIAQGSPYGDEQSQTVQAIRVVPVHRRMWGGSQQQLMVEAVYSDGTIEDVTRTVQFEANDSEMAEVSESGLVQIKQLAGEVAVMARYQGHVATFHASVPLTEGQHHWPEPRNEIDLAVLKQLQSLNIPMSARCDDATFLRRVTLDLTGRLPTVDETMQFLTSDAQDKRDELIERLLASDDYADYFANKWMLILRNRRTAPTQQSGTFAFHRWIREALATNLPYDQFVQEIITAAGGVDECPPVVWYRNVSDNHSRVEDMAQLFLGQRIQCARCHHHPYEKWSQNDYFKLSAFFSQVRTKPGSSPDEPMLYSELGQGRAAHPKTGQPLAPAGLDGPTIELRDYQDPRVALADWMTQPENPFFAKSLANRYWKHFFGRGLVEPEDDMRVTNPPSNPELLTTLADHLVAAQFDLRSLIRFICQSETYQRANEAVESNVLDRKCFSRYYPKRMTAEVLLDAIDQTLDSRTTFDMMPDQTRAVALPDTAFVSYFLSVFGRPDATTACECERPNESTLAQSLQLANSKELQSKLANDQARPARLAADTARSDAEKIDEIYLVALSRWPQAEEKQAAADYLGRKADKRAAFEDLLWVLINSKEFLFNH